MRPTLTTLALVLGCAFQDRTIGDEIQQMGTMTADGSASGNVEGSSSTAADEPHGILVGAVLGSDGLCPYMFQRAFPLTLQFTPGDNPCNARMRDELIEEGDLPSWYMWLGVPLVTPGVYDFAGDEDDFISELIDADEGGGAAGGGRAEGSIEIFTIDERGVSGELHNVDFGILSDDAPGDLSGRFTARWCTEAEWLDIEFDPTNVPEEGWDPACKHPPG
jgi:hypothetical protein